jgi:hypothetical protein
MEGSMDNETRSENCKYDSNRPPTLDSENRAGPAGLWFAAAVLFAVLAAGVIIYRTGSADFRTASNDAMPSAAQTDPISPAPLLQQR